MKKKKTNLLLVISIVQIALFTICQGSFSIDIPAMYISPLNPSFYDYIKKNDKNTKNQKNKKNNSISYTKSDQNSDLGLIPDPVLSEIHDPEMDIDFQIVDGHSPYDIKYDMRDPNDDGNQNDSLLTPVKNQSSCGVCWTFATYGAIESNRKKNFIVQNDQNDFSENHLKNMHGFDLAPCSGGNIKMSAAYLFRHSGPVLEINDPYSSSEDSQYCYDCEPDRYIDNVIFMPVRSDSNDIAYIKQAVLTYGGIYSSILFDETFFDSNNNTYYYDDPDDSFNNSNHSIVIVGWDDEKYISNSPANGAFIVRNSFGDSWGENGYFYVSYYDESIAFTKLAYFIDKDDDSFKFNKIFQYDNLGWTGGIGTGDNSDWGANVFTSDENIEITAIGFYATGTNMSYNIDIFESFDDEGGYGRPINSLLDTPISGLFKYSGYYIVKLEKPVIIKQGNNFVVAIKFETLSNTYPVPLEVPIPYYSSEANSKAGQSYVSDYGDIYFDLSHFSENSNVCIKVYANPHIDNPPVAYSQQLETNEDTSLQITLNGIDPNGGILTFFIVSQPLYGKLEGTIPDLTYIPYNNYNGNDNFKFKVNNGSHNSEIATIDIIIKPLNDAPIPEKLNIITNEDSPISFSGLGYDPDGDDIIFIIDTPFSNGTLEGVYPNLIYTPDPDFNGEDNMIFYLSDMKLNSENAPLKITVLPKNDKPVANIKIINVNEDSQATIKLTGDDVDNDPLTYNIITSTENGTLKGNAPDLIYTPKTNFYGSDKFDFYVSDGLTNSEIATCFIIIDPVNDKPVANDLEITISQNISKNIELSGYDIDGDQITFEIKIYPKHGLILGRAPNLIYVPRKDYSGTDSFEYITKDQNLSSNNATASIIINPVNEEPVANLFNLMVNENTAKAFKLTGDDPDGDNLSYKIITNPSHGLILGKAPNLIYVPSKNYFGSDSFSYIVNDGILDSKITKVSVYIIEINNPPKVSSLNLTTQQNQEISFKIDASDEDNDALSFIIESMPSNGNLSGEFPNFTYKPDSEFSGNDSISFKVNDGAKDSNIGTISIVVISAPANLPPKAISQVLIMNEDQPFSITLTGSDHEDSVLSYSISRQPAHGKIIGIPPKIVYIPHVNYYGNDGFIFTVSDSKTSSEPASISLIINPKNDTPVAISRKYSTDEDTNIPVELTSYDPDKDIISYIITQNPLHGNITGTVPNLIYEPNLNYNGEDSFEFRVSDGLILSAIAKITIDIKPVNDQPIAKNKTIVVSHGKSISFTLPASDPDNDYLEYTLLSKPLIGDLIENLPQLTYSAPLGYSGTQQFNYIVNDGKLFSQIATITIIVPDFTVITDRPGIDQRAVYDSSTMTPSQGNKGVSVTLDNNNVIYNTGDLVSASGTKGATTTTDTNKTLYHWYPGMSVKTRVTWQQ